MTCKELSVGPDWRVQFEKAFYSAPHRLIGTRVLAMGNSHTVRIFLDFEEVTSHQRASRPWEIKRNSEHAPPELEQYLNLTSEGLVQWAQRLEPSVGLVAELILADRAVAGLRPVRALIIRSGDMMTTSLCCFCVVK